MAFQQTIVTGSLAYDRIMDFEGKFSDHILPEKIHQINLSFYIPRMKINFGGTGGNIAYNLQQLGEKPVLVGKGGTDFGVYKDWLRKNKISLRGLSYSKKLPTASAYIITDKSDNQITGFYPGALLEKNKLKKNFLQKKQWGIVAAENKENMRSYSQTFYGAQTPFIFDPGQQITSLNKKDYTFFIDKASILIANDYEISVISKKVGWSLGKLVKKIPTIITYGSQGSQLYHPSGNIRIGAVKVSSIDPTGAGDAYRAGLLHGLNQGYSWKKILQLASTTASFAVEKYGTQNHTIGQKKLYKRCRENYKK